MRTPKILLELKYNILNIQYLIIRHKIKIRVATMSQSRWSNDAKILPLNIF